MWGLFNMSGITPIPLKAQITDETGMVTLPWALFFSSVYEGDTSTAWIPSITSLTTTGSATITGRYYLVIRRIVVFFVTITTSGTTASTAGATYINNLPIPPYSDGACFVVTNGTGGVGHVVASNNRVYLPTWVATANQVSIIGVYEAAS
jgi:hypothetical protein